jgi:hypothetical protein
MTRLHDTGLCSVVSFLEVHESKTLSAGPQSRKAFKLGS